MKIKKSCTLKLVLISIYTLVVQSQCPHCSFTPRVYLTNNNFVLSVH